MNELQLYAISCAIQHPNPKRTNIDKERNDRGNMQVWVNIIIEQQAQHHPECANAHNFHMSIHVIRENGMERKLKEKKNTIN